MFRGVSFKKVLNYVRSLDSQVKKTQALANLLGTSSKNIEVVNDTVFHYTGYDNITHEYNVYTEKERMEWAINDIILDGLSADSVFVDISFLSEVTGKSISFIKSIASFIQYGEVSCNKNIQELIKDTCGYESFIKQLVKDDYGTWLSPYNGKEYSSKGYFIYQWY